MIFYEEPSATVYCGHALKELAGLADNSVDCVMTSPPYWGLRTYKTEPIIWGDNHCEHEWGDLIPNPMCKSGKHGPASVIGAKDAEHQVRKESNQGNFCLKCGAWRGELGLEPTIEFYIDHLIQIFDEVKRVLKKTGTCWVNIGDSYASGTRKTNKSQTIAGGNEQDLPLGYSPSRNMPDYPAKSLCLIPERFALGMVNRGWILRNVIIWYKSNPMPESVKDRFTGTYEYVYFFTKAQRYWFEQQFEAQSEGTFERYANDNRIPAQVKWRDSAGESHTGMSKHIEDKQGVVLAILPQGRNKRDVWEINTQPYPEAHFATFPEKLCETPILSGCPSHICKKCGKAREKIIEGTSSEAFNIRVRDVQKGRIKRSDRIASETEVLNYQEGITHVGEGIREVGYTDCGCNAGFEPGTVLDPFCGSGKALAVAKKLGRKAIGIDLSPDYCKMTLKQLQAISIPMKLE